MASNQLDSHSPPWRLRSPQGPSGNVLPRSALFLYSPTVFPLRHHEYWFCEKQDCSSPDRASGLQGQFLIHCWLQELKSDPVRKRILGDLVRSEIPLALFCIGEATLVRRVEQLLISGQLHFHKKEREVQSGSGDLETQVPFPLSQRQPREASAAPPVFDPPSFSPDVDLAAQAATLVAAAAQGVPFCPE